MASGNDTQTSSTSTAPTNSNVTNTTNKLLGGIDNAWAAGPSTFNESLYAGLGTDTKTGLGNLWNVANNPNYLNSVQGSINTLGQTASGANLGQNDPGYATMRAKLGNDVLTSTNGAFNNSGLFGSDNNKYSAASGLADSLGALDYRQYNDSQDRQVQAAQMLPDLYGALQAPANTQLQVGAIQDADKQAALQGRYDLSQRQGNAQTDLLAKLSSILAGNAQAGGSTTTSTTPTTPWWQSAIGIGLGAL